MVDTTWTFAVIFIAIFGVLIVFGVMWLMSQGPSSTAERLPSDSSAQRARAGRASREKVSPDVRDGIPDELDGAPASSSRRRPAGLVHS
jgi:hypothetical protein